MIESPLTLKNFHENLKTKKVSSIELTEEILSRIRKFESKIDAFITIDSDLALDQARKADRLISENQEISTLHGIPMSIKDIIVTEDIKTTCASKVLEDFKPPYNATIVNKLLDKRVVVVGKTNMDEFGMGSSTENSAFKVTKNPWNLNKVPGGSSGGSAAAVSAGLSTYSLGSDTGGSIRQPASFCGVVGMKPTYGRVSRYGLIAMASSLDQIGSITRTVEDAAVILRNISGYDPKDSNCVNRKVPDFTQSLTKEIKGLKVGIIKESFSEGVDTKIKEKVEDAIKGLENLGAHVQEISLKNSNNGVAVYYLIMPSEVSSNMARYDGVRYGYGREKFGDEVKRRIMLGTYALSSGYFDAYYLKAAKVRTLIINEFKEAFRKVDVIVGPTTPTTAFNIGEKTKDPLEMYLSDVFTVVQNLAGLPAISIPCGFVDGMPVGLQITGDHWQEEKILNVAHVYEQSTNWHKEKPKL